MSTPQEFNAKHIRAVTAEAQANFPAQIMDEIILAARRGENHVAWNPHGKSVVSTKAIKAVMEYFMFLGFDVKPAPSIVFDYQMQNAIAIDTVDDLRLANGILISW